VVRSSDEKSVITYLVAYYNYFSKLRTEEKDLKRLNKVLLFLTEMETLQLDYEARPGRSPPPRSFSFGTG
jgi:spectrin beta